MKDREVRSCIYINTVDRTDRRNGCIISCINRSDQILAWIY